MKHLRNALIVIGILIVAVIYFKNWSFIHSRKVEGVIVKVERIPLNIAMMQDSSEKINPQLFSFAVAIKDSTGEIVTASTEDRQWAVAQQGQCAEARFYPYPPWNFNKAGTYFNARLDKLWDCSSK